MGQASQTVFTLFLAADLLSFGLMAHFYLAMKTGSTIRGTTLMVLGLAIMVFFVAGFIVAYDGSAAPRRQAYV